jgi:membrane-associated protease RseP (regulator of RpoE activity)
VNDSIAYLIGVVLLLLGVGLSIGLHEIGHLVPAKLFGARVTKYMIGFGPTLFSRKRGETEYGIKLIPLGGYIAISGMLPPEGEKQKFGRLATWIRDARRNQATIDGEYDPSRAFYLLSVPKRIIVMLGGPFMNLVLGLVFFAIALSGIGTWQSSTKIATVSDCVPAGDSETCSPDDPVSPAKVAGLLDGDRIVMANGVSLTNLADLRTQIDKVGTSPIALQVNRDGKLLDFTVTPTTMLAPVQDPKTGQIALDSNDKPILKPRAVLGITADAERIPLSVQQTLAFTGNVVVQTGQLILGLPEKLYALTVDMFDGKERAQDGPVSIVGVSDIVGKIAQDDQYDAVGKLTSGLLMLGSLNIGLFVFNLIPLLPLDGGHVLNALYEGVKRRLFRLFKKTDPGPVDTAKMLPFTTVMWFVLLAIGLLVIAADFVNPVQLN